MRLLNKKKKSFYYFFLHFFFSKCEPMIFQISIVNIYVYKSIEYFEKNVMISGCYNTRTGTDFTS
jgi:hypothetical protein